MSPGPQDKGAGGKYLVLPPDYTGDTPDGYFVLQSPTYCNWIFLRGNTSSGLEKAVDHITSTLRIHPLASADDPPSTKFVNISGRHYNTIAGNDMSYSNPGSTRRGDPVRSSARTRTSAARMPDEWCAKMPSDVGVGVSPAS